MSAGMGWTIAEAVEWLDPPLNDAEARALVLLFAVPVRGQRRGRGRPVPEYDQPAILRAHAAVIAVREGLMHALLGPRPAASG
jgi:hypothetical protein